MARGPATGVAVAPPVPDRVPSPVRVPDGAPAPRPGGRSGATARPGGPERFASAEDLVAAWSPTVPVLALRPRLVARAAAWFVANFPGDVAYACKANDSDRMVRLVTDAGVRHLDVASMAEIETGLRLPGTVLHLMNPVKPRATISLAYHKAGVRSFALDSWDELAKIMAETGQADDLGLMVRVAVPGAPDAGVPLQHKFGAVGAEAIEVLRAARTVAAQVGVSFHVGSQARTPGAWAEALRAVGRLVAASGVAIDVVDVGGGFPARYGADDPTSLTPFMEAIAGAAPTVPGVAAGRCRLMCEPGRALVAEGESLIVQVLARRGQELFLDDGAFGALYDAGHHGVPFPVRLVGGSPAPSAPFSFWGPSCTSEDRMPGPFLLPADVREGDHLEIGLVGAYGRVLASRFNGFGAYREAVVDDEPFPSMYPA